MAEQKHTPGPWVVSRESNEWNSPSAPRREIDALKACEFGGEPTRYRLACVQYPPTQSGTIGAQEREANARLIAAAPDLLAACKTLIRYATKRDGAPADIGDVIMTFVEDGSTLNECLDAAAGAIDKAEGR